MNCSAGRVRLHTSQRTRPVEWRSSLGLFSNQSLNGLGSRQMPVHLILAPVALLGVAHALQTSHQLVEPCFVEFQRSFVFFCAIGINRIVENSLGAGKRIICFGVACRSNNGWSGGVLFCQRRLASCMIRVEEIQQTNKQTKNSPQFDCVVLCTLLFSPT